MATETRVRKITLSDLHTSGELDGYRRDRHVNEIDADICARAACRFCDHDGTHAVAYRRPGNYRVFGVCPSCGMADEL